MNYCFAVAKPAQVDDLTVLHALLKYSPFSSQKGLIVLVSISQFYDES